MTERVEQPLATKLVKKIFYVFAMAHLWDYFTLLVAEIREQSTDQLLADVDLFFARCAIQNERDEAAETQMLCKCY